MKMTSVNRKCPPALVLFIITGCLHTCMCEAQATDACSRNGLINVETQYGHIGSNDTVLHAAGDCQLWSIQGHINDTVLIRISVANFNKTFCAAGSNLILGPLPYLDICALDTINLPLIYRSKRDHIWIKYLIGSQPWDKVASSQFSLDYITSSSKNCSFRCIFDDTCIPKHWQCNGQPECSKGEDEYMCRSTTGTVDNPPHAVASPDVVIQYPQTSFTLYGDRSTDDHGIVEYIWTKTGTDALSCDMQGTRTSRLSLSNLEVGDYTFRLTVTDKLGQTSSADVHVTVKQAGSAPSQNTSKLVTPHKLTSVVPTCFHCYVLAYGSYSCLPNEQLCDGITHCQFDMDEDEYACENKKRRLPKTTKSPASPQCEYHEIYCYVTRLRRSMCLHNMYECNGNSDCANGEDEDPTMCGTRLCNKRMEDTVGWFASPNFPSVNPPMSLTRCSWVIHQQGSSQSSTIQLRVVIFSLADAPDTDYVKVYDGPDSTYDVIGIYTGSNPPPPIIESTSNWMNVVFHSDNVNGYHGFNFTYQIKGECLPSQRRCVGENDCYDLTDRCNGIWDCPLKGSDEIGCGNCKDDYSCGKQTVQCYHPTERCNGLARCSNSFDEINCTSRQCGTHNGTFLCDNRRCIYESWTCDERDDCGDNSDEQFCTGTTKRVVIAAICGSMICALLLVILLGCSCKLYSLRTMDHHRYPRHETPMSRLYAEFMRRRAPPPYHEAMLTSRNFDEVQQEYLERMRNSRRNHRGSRSNRRRSRNQHNQSQTESAESNQNSATSDNNENLHEGSSGMQLCTINEENENENHVNTGRTSSTAELLPSESETDSDDLESETDLAEQDEGQSEGHTSNSSTAHVTEIGNDDDEDDENILTSTSLSAQWTRTVDSEDSSDDACILDAEENDCLSEGGDSRGQGHCDNASVDTEATASIASMEHEVIRNSRSLFKDNENETDTDEEALENSRNSTPKPDSNHGNAVISDTSADFVRRSTSQTSLDSIGSEAHSEGDMPLLPMNSVVSQHF